MPKLRLVGAGMIRLRHLGPDEFLHRLLAVGCIVMVLALGMFAANPTLHEQLHHAGPLSPDDGCAVVLFASGLVLVLGLHAGPLGPRVGRRMDYLAARELILVASRYRQLPGRGPPVS